MIYCGLYSRELCTKRAYCRCTRDMSLGASLPRHTLPHVLKKKPKEERVAYASEVVSAM